MAADIRLIAVTQKCRPSVSRARGVTGWCSFSWQVRPLRNKAFLGDLQPDSLNVGMWDGAVNINGVAVARPHQGLVTAGSVSHSPHPP